MKRYFACLITFVFLLISAVPVVHARTEDAELYVARGIQKINEQNYSSALMLLKRAIKISPNSIEAVFYSGVAYTGLKNYKKAETAFYKVLQLDKDAVEAYFELGRIYYLTFECSKSSGNFSRFIALTAESPLKKQAEKMRKDCKKERRGEKRYKLDITLGGQYDSNVILEPDNPPVAGAGDADDIRGTVYISAAATLYEIGPAKLKVNYKFYQSFHADLDDYNIHYHNINPYIVVDILEPLQATAGYTLTYTLFGDELYSRKHIYQGKLKLKEGKHLSTEAIIEYKDNKYWDAPLFSTNRLRRGHTNTYGIKQNFTVKKLAGHVFYFADFNRAETAYWSYDGHRAGAKLVYQITTPLFISVSGEYNKRSHKAVFLGSSLKRKDEMTKYGAKLTYYIIPDRLSVALTDTYTNNSSNLSNYDYSRNIVGIFLKVGVL